MVEITKSNFDSDNCKKYSKDELTEFAKKLKIPYSGTKDKICERIKTHLSDSKSPSSKKDTSSSKKKKTSKSDEDDFDVIECSSYTLVQLKEYAKKFGLRVSGTKSELCDRLREKFSCDLPKKSEEIFNPKKCDGNNPSYSKYELEKFAKKNKISVKKNDTKRDICEKLSSKAECKELEVVEISKKREKSPSKKRKIIEEEESETSEDEEEKPKIKDDFDEKKCGDKPRYLKAKIIDFAKKYGVKHDGTSKDICIRIKKYLNEKNVPEKEREEIKETVKKVLKSKSKIVIEEETSSEEDDEETPKISDRKLRELLKKTRDISVIDKYKNSLSDDDYWNYTKLSDKHKKLFIDMLYNFKNQSIHELLEYFIKEKSYRQFFMLYHNRAIGGKKNLIETIDEFDYLLGEKLVAKFKALSAETRKNIAEKYVYNIKPLSHFISVNECNEDNNNCYGEVCDIGLGQCVNEDDLANRPEDSLENNGKRIIGDKTSISLLRKKLGIKTEKELKEEREMELKEKETRLKNLSKEKEEKRKIEEKRTKRKELEDKNLKEEMNIKSGYDKPTNLPSPRIKGDTEPPWLARAKEAEKNKPLIRRKTSIYPTIFQDDYHGRNEEKKLDEDIGIKTSNKGISMNKLNDLFEDLNTNKPLIRKQSISPIFQNEKLKEGDEIFESDDTIKIRSASNKGISMDKLNDLFEDLNDKSPSQRKQSISPNRMNSSEIYFDKMENLYGSSTNKGEFFETNKEREEKRENKRIRKEEKREDKRIRKERVLVAEKEANDALQNVYKKREEDNKKLEQKEIDNKAKQETTRLKKIEDDIIRKEQEDKMIPLGRNLKNDEKMLDESRKRINKELERREEEQELQEIPSKEELLILSKELDKPQKEIARCLGLIL